MANANTATVTCSGKTKLQSTRQYSLDNLLPADYYPCYTVSNFTFLKDKKEQLCLFPQYYTQQIAIPEFNWKMTIMVPLDNLYWSWAISLVITLIIYLLFCYLLNTGECDLMHNNY